MKVQVRTLFFLFKKIMSFHIHYTTSHEEFIYKNADNCLSYVCMYEDIALEL